MKKQISDLFHPPPASWGLRGDPYLWDEMERRFAGIDLPESREELASVLRSAFLELTGVTPDSGGAMFIERFSGGGMSSGKIDLGTWREKLLPLLLGRGEETMGEK